MPVRPDDPRPPYVQLAAELRDAIRNGDYQPGDRLPSTRQLAEANGIAPMTVQHAVRVLRNEGLIVGQQGRGTFVTDAPVPAAEDATSVSPEADSEPAAASVDEVLDRALRQLGGTDVGDGPGASDDDLDIAIRTLEAAAAALKARSAARAPDPPAYDPGPEIDRSPGMDI